MTAQAQPPPVLVADLRGGGTAEALAAGSFAEYLRQRARGDGVAPAAAGRVLVIDDAAALVDHHQAYEKILTSRIVETLLCVAVGPPHSTAVALRRSQVLAPPAAVTLWAGDPRGTVWRVGATYADLTADLADEPADPLAAGAAVDADPISLLMLVDALRVPEIFDRVVELAGQMPYATASPGLRVLLSAADEDLLVDTETQAIRRLTDAAAEGADSPLANPLAILAGGADPVSAGVPEPLSPTGYISDLYARSVEACDEAQRLLDRMEGWRGLVGSDDPAETWRAVEAAGEAVEEFVGELARAFAWVDGSAGLDPDRLRFLGQFGVQVAPVPGTDRTATVAAFRQAVLDRLVPRRSGGASHSVVALVGWLREFATRAAPRGSAAYADRLHELCPRTLIEGLLRPPRVRVPLGDLGMLAANFVGCALLTLWPPALVPGTLLGVGLALAGAVRVLVRRPRPADERLVSGGQALGVAVHGAVAVAGVVAARYLSVPAWAGLVALPAGLAVLLVMPVRRWARMISRWRGKLRLSETEQAVGKLRDLLVSVALNEWLLADARRRAADLAIALAGVLDEVGRSLAGQVAQPAVAPSSDSAVGDESPQAQGGVDREVADRLREHATELQDVVHGDMAAVAALALEASWPNLARGALADLTRGVAGRVTRAMAAYREHIRREGVLAPPPFVSDEDRQAARAELAEAVWRQSEQLPHLLRANIRDPGILQLCAPDQLPALDASPAMARLVPFAPRTAQSAVAGDGPAGQRLVSASDVMWTRSGQLAGVLRLVPLRSGALETVWPKVSSANDTAPAEVPADAPAEPLRESG
jgi:hypothetical protein